MHDIVGTSAKPSAVLPSLIQIEVHSHWDTTTHDSHFHLLYHAGYNESRAAFIRVGRNCRRPPPPTFCTVAHRSTRKHACTTRDFSNMRPAPLYSRVRICCSLSVQECFKVRSSRAEEPSTHPLASTTEYRGLCCTAPSYDEIGVLQQNFLTASDRRSCVARFTCSGGVCLKESHNGPYRE